MPLLRFGLSKPKRIQGQAQQDLENVLTRSSSIDPVTPLIASLDVEADEVDLDRVAIGFDTNALLRVVGHRKSYEVIDYFGRARNAPTILPGQSVQEFWNNQSKGYGSVANKIRADFANLSRTIQSIDDRFDDFSLRFDELFSQFRGSFENVFDEDEQRSTKEFFENLRSFSVIRMPRAAAMVRLPTSD